MWRRLTHNTLKYTRFILRRDRIRIPIWLFSLLLVSLAVVPYFHQLEQSGEAQAMAETMNNPAVIAMVGIPYGIDEYNTGPMLAHEMLLFTAITVAIMNILMVTRHTREDEESGCTEMLRSLPVGRLSNLCGTLLVAAGVNIAMALLIGLGLYAFGIESIDLAGSLLYGAALGATGIIFAAITALYAQLSANSRSTTGYSFAILGVMYITRAIGDVSNETLAWFSPLGWVLRTQVYVNNYWWPIILTLIAALAVTVAAIYLNSIRDLGASFISPKPGRKTASPLLHSPLGLTGRLLRPTIIGWAVALLILSAAYGAVFNDIQRYFDSNELVRQMLSPVAGYTITEQFMTLLLMIMAMAAAIPSAQMIFRLKGEENSNRIEHIYSRGVSRSQYLGSYLTLSLASGAIMLFLTALGMWSAAAAVMDDPIAFSSFLLGAMIYLPALWVVTGLATFLVGIAPKLSSLVWVYMGHSFFVGYFGALLKLPQWLIKTSLFEHVPQLPVDEMNYTVIAVMTAIAIVLAALGFVGYNRRDIG